MSNPSKTDQPNTEILKDTALVSEGDHVTYENHLREYRGAEQEGTVLHVVRTHFRQHEQDYVIIFDEGRIRSVHHTSIVSVH